MPTYVSLVNWTDQGVRAGRESAQRAKAAAELAQRMGGELKATYWTIGPYDIVVISDFPDDESATAFLLAIGAQGNIRTVSMRAFDAGEFGGILSKLE